MAASDTVRLYDVPSRSIDEAKLAVQTNPDDPVAYLALATAYWQAGQLFQARSSVREGLPRSADDAVYFLTAAGIAAELGQGPDASIYYLTAYTRSEGQETHELARALAGEYFYGRALAVGDLNPAQTMRAIAREQNIQNLDLDSSLIQLAAARLQISTGQFRRAQGILEQLLAGDSLLAEVHLVNGELQLAMGNTSGAITEWNTAAAAQDAPDWVQRRAAELLNTTQGS
jgi:tetratricopeptide (TPR) repeat protein